MANKKSRDYIVSKETKPNPLKNKNDIARNTDSKIDQDFPGYPYGHASKEIINPATDTDRKVADVENKDGEKRDRQQDRKINEDLSDGSASAFDATESVKE